ncbi:exocyst complex component exo84 [Pseudocyphellaria aurata]|nr:exocyst complex component exo84 [Pseudocyphellaria aurata]
MEEKSKAFSLRQKKSSRRPPISAPQQISSTAAPVPLPVGNGNFERYPGAVQGARNEKPEVARQRPRPGGHTSDLVKRRYSTRFTTLGDFRNADAPPIPEIRTGGSNPSTQQKAQTSSAAVHKIEVDLTALRDTGLRADDYATNLLSDATDQDLRHYQSSLRKIKNRTSTDLQQNVYQNRTQFIKISKEADKLKGEMRTLRGLMSELTTSISNASVDAVVPEPRVSLDNGLARARKQANRSSVANLEAMWNVQLHALWKNVEGSQKFLPAIPGRHVVHETGYWMELDAATWKSKRPAHLFLLNDHLLVATKKKKQRGDSNALVNGDATQKSSTKLLADRCWPLQEIDIIDIAASGGSTNLANERSEMSNAISIRHGHESFTYRFDKSSNAEKGNLLQAFRRAADELRRALRVDAEEVNSKAQETMDYFATRDPALSKKPELVQSMSSTKDRPEILIEVDGKHQDFRWVEGQIDELDSEVALQRFEDAVRHVEKLRRLARGLKNNMVARDIIVAKVDERARKLGDLVTQRLVDTHSFLKATQTNVAWLVRLGFDDSAREAFLKARTEVIAKRNRQILFEGNLHHHIFQISFVYFTLIRNTVSIYQQCFPLLMMSACVKWAKEHLDAFNRVLASQLSNVQRDSPTWTECMERSREHAKMMDEVGLDFKDLVGVEFEDEVEDIVQPVEGDQ